MCVAGVFVVVVLHGSRDQRRSGPVDCGGCLAVWRYLVVPIAPSIPAHSSPVVCFMQLCRCASKLLANPPMNTSRQPSVSAALRVNRACRDPAATKRALSLSDAVQLVFHLHKECYESMIQHMDLRQMVALSRRPPTPSPRRCQAMRTSAVDSSIGHDLPEQVQLKHCMLMIGMISH